jgi:hypothetical protein
MKSHQLYTLLIIGILTISNCNTEMPIVVNPEKEITTYHKSTLTTEKKNTDFDKSINVYIDYSGGMFLPINQCYDLIDEVITITNKENTVFYNVGLGSPYKIKGNVLKPSHPKNPRQNSNYTDAESYLNDAIDSITTDYNSQSIFITDFELYRDGRFDPSPWATLDFENWLSKGHQIDVFAKEFTNGYNKSQYLYIILFTPKNYPVDESLINRLTQDNLANGKELEWFSFSNNLGTIVKNGSAYDKKTIYATQEYEEEKFGYYAFDYTVVSSKPLFSSIALKNTSQNYKKIKIDYEVTDISTSFSNKGKGQAPSKEIFDISINNNQEEYTFEVKLSNNLKGLIKPKELYRIDFFLTNATADFDEERMNNILQWTDEKSGMTFSSLNKSLQEAIKRVKPQKELLYTYYIELSL